jgi:hypothetical protein
MAPRLDIEQLIGKWTRHSDPAFDGAKTEVIEWVQRARSAWDWR